MRQFKKILIINIFGIGDVLFTTPILTNLKIYNKDVQIGYVCNRRTVSVIEQHPCVDQVFIYERDEFNEVYKKSKIAFWRKIKAFVQEIKNEHYDVVFDFSMNTFTGFFAWMAGIAVRSGFDYKKRGIFLNKKILLEGFDDKHVVEYYLDFLRKFNIPVKETRLSLSIGEKDQQGALDYIENKNFKKPIINIMPGGGASWGKDAYYKRWPAENFAKLADKLIEKFSVDIILMGSLQEKELCQQVESLMKGRPTVLCGKTNIMQLAALSRICALNIVNDGGPLHIAVSAGSKTLSIFGPVNEYVYGPYSREGHDVVTADIACRPCYRRFRRASCTHISCLKNIKIEDVLRKVENLL
ncbi:hypothetical protein MNBD_UNCLBAC01-349 [hydrothermal vent metagenome]|uniref:lipopolysaccharide heptosyltransferase II n=1 Tax=hydrothermal vent metagenome TaxID=652676 RepID=A0A3B1DPE2_9ZZZZ